MPIFEKISPFRNPQWGHGCQFWRAGVGMAVYQLCHYSEYNNNGYVLRGFFGQRMRDEVDSFPPDH
jgi:hypothetical protein